MQINNNPQCPQPKSTSFGMAVKITKEGADYLRRQSPKTLEKLSAIGEEMKDYKHWDLLVTDKSYVAKPREFLKSGYKDYITVDDSYISPHSRALNLNTVYSDFADKGTKATIVIDDLKEGEAAEIAQRIKAEDHLGRFAETIRLLEQKSAKEAAQKAYEEAEKAKISGMVDDLVSKFGIDTEV